MYKIYSMVCVFVFASLVTKAQVPNEPTNLVITPINTGGMVQFTAPSNIGGSTITNYEYSTDGGTTWVTPSPAITESPLIISSGLTNCTSYPTKLRAVNTSGSGTESSAAQLIPATSVDMGVNWTARNAVATITPNGVTYANGIFVAVGSGTFGSLNRVITSPDGINWTARNAAATNTWRSVTYGNGVFVAVSSNGTGNRVMTSPDGINWTIRTSAANDSWYSVTYGNGLFVAVAINGSGVMTSPDGINWTTRTPASNNAWFSVTYGNGLFVAVSYTGSGTGNRVMTSPNGINWTSRNSAADISWGSVTYGNGLFVAVAFSGGNGTRVMTSPNGITWTSRTSAADKSWVSVTYGNGLFVAVSGGGGTVNEVMTSPDGINWTARNAAVSNSWSSVTYGNGSFVAVSSTFSPNWVMTSSYSPVADAPVISSATLGSTSTINFTQSSSVYATTINNYEYSTDNGSNWTAVSPAATTSPLTITGLANVPSSMMIRAVNSVGNSCSSNNYQAAICTPTSFTETITACGSYTWHDSTFTASNNTATWTGVNAAGCDSVVTLNLTITTPPTDFSAGGINYVVTSDTTVAVGDNTNASGSLVIPATVTTDCGSYAVTRINANAFQGSSVTTVSIPNSIKTIFDYTFSSCSNLTSVIIPNSVTSIGENAFSFSGLTSVTIPNSVTSIGFRSFSFCYDLRSVIIPNSVTSIGESAFSYCALTSVTIPNSVTSIEPETFYGCTSLTSVIIPNSVNNIGAFAFTFCYDLPSVTIPNSVTSIGTAAFEECISLTSVTIPNSVTTIGERAFKDCSGLTSVTIPNSVTSIGRTAFSGCSGLTSVICSIITPLSINSDVFTNVNQSACSLTVPSGSVAAYRVAAVWKNFAPISCANPTVNTTTISACGSYTWANNNETYTISGVYTGDTTNCIIEQLNLTITTPPITPIVNVVNNCNGTSTLSTTATGTLLWSTGATTSSIIVSSAGTYTVTQTVDSCTSETGSGTAAPKTAPATPTVNVVNNCNGTSTLSTTATGTLLWSTGATTSSIIVSSAGTYTVTQTVDSCTSEAGSGTAAPKTTPATPTVNVINNTNGTSTLSTAASGTLLWNNGSTTSSIIVSSAGTYSVTQTVDGCVSEAGSGTAAPITQADPAISNMYFTDTAGENQDPNYLLLAPSLAVYDINIPFYNLNQTNSIPNQTIEFRVNLGRKLILNPSFNLATAPLSSYFDWSETSVGGDIILVGTQKADIPSDFNSIATFRVKGDSACRSNVVSNIVITNLAQQLNDDDAQNNTASLQYNLPITLTRTFVNVTCNGANNGNISVVASSGTRVIVSGPNGYADTTYLPSGSNNFTKTGLAPGVYSIAASATSASPLADCSVSTTATIVEPSLLVLPSGNISQTNINCFGASDASISISASGGTSPYTYVIAGPTVNTSGALSGTFTGLLAGSYTITVTDNNGCSAQSGAIVITAPSGITDITLGSDVTATAFNAPGVTQTIVYNIAEIAAAASVGDTIRVTKVNGFTINFSATQTQATVGSTTYNVDNSRWKIDNSNAAFLSIILTDPGNSNGPGTILCSSLVRVAISITRNSPGISVFALSARLRKANGEVNLNNNLNSIIFSAE